MKMNLSENNARPKLPGSSRFSHLKTTPKRTPNLTVLVKPMAAVESSPRTNSINNKTPEQSPRYSGGRKSPSSPLENDMNRVHEELEKLNIATDVINKLELQLDEARNAFREIQTSWSTRLQQLLKKLGNCIEKSRPYYETRAQTCHAQEEAQKAALRFERANSMHAVAKQQVSLTQDSLGRQDPKNVDPACLEVLNHHIQRVNEAEKERIQSEEEHKRVSAMVEEVNRKLAFLEKELGRNIKKSKPYFDSHAEFTRVLQDQKLLIGNLEKEIRQKKVDYTTSLRNLEKISEQIHERRQLGKREAGVGSETPGPSATEVERNTRGLSVNTEDQKTIDKLRESPHSPKIDAVLQNLSPVDNVDKKERSKSEPPEPLMVSLRPAPAPAATQAARPVTIAGVHNGVILIAHQLSEYGWFPDDRRLRAFSFPPEDLDVAYKTVPEGVKQFPTPPETPTSPTVRSMTKRTSPTLGPRLLTIPSVPSSDAISITSVGSSACLSEQSSVSSFTGASIGGPEDDARLNQIHSDLIDEIESAADRAKSIAIRSDSNDDLPSFDRGSASGESSSDADITIKKE